MDDRPSEQVSDPHEMSLLDLVPIAVLVGGADAQVTSANRSWSELSGLAHTESIGDGWGAALHHVDHGHVLNFVARIGGDDGRVHSAEYRLIGPSGLRWTRWWIRRATGRAGPLLLMAVSDISDDRARQEELLRDATHDSLTGLVNASQFLVLTEEALERSDGTDVAVVFVDLEGFKNVNDTAGHRFGDRVLAAVAGRLHAAVRPMDVVGRVGGDEFAVLCQELGGADHAERVASRIRAAFEDPLEVDGGQWGITPTVGLATAVEATTAEGLLDAADRAMYRAKQSGDSRGLGRFRTGGSLRSDGDASPRAQPLVELAEEAIHRLFGIGLTLVAHLTRSGASPGNAHLEEAIRTLDETIWEMRALVSGSPGDPEGSTP